MNEATDERHPRDFETLLETLADNLAGELQADVNKLAQHFAGLRKLAGLVSTAAAKHTGACARARQGLGGGTLGATLPEKIQINGDAVGRLHNAAKLARKLLDNGACQRCTDAADTGVDVTDRSGTCAECGRVLGLL